MIPFYSTLLKNSTLRSFVGAMFFIFCSVNSGAQSFYDLGTIQKIEIWFSQSNWDYQMDTAKAGAEGYIKADWVKVNGTLFNNVGVKYKGNSSYNIASIKNPLHIELDAYQNQSYNGIVDIKLGNNYQDPSMIREVLSYQILGNYMDCPKSNFAKVYINGAYYGVYSNTESINKKFYSNHFYTSDNISVKCNPAVIPGSATKCNLRYLGNDSAAYLNFYEVKSDYGWNDLVRLCDTVTNFPSSLENNLDLDRAIWMLAFNTALINLDSYSGAFCQNYYLYKNEHNRYTPVIWDLNMNFGGFPFVGTGTVSLGSLSISQEQQLALNIHATDIHWPLINKIQGNARWKKMFNAHIKTIINEMIATGTYTSLATVHQALIDTSVQSDTHKSYSYTNFQNGLTANVSVGSYSVPGIAVLMNARNNFLQTQTEFTSIEPVVSGVACSNGSLNAVVTITAQITNANYVQLAYRFNNRNLFTKVTMLDDGAHGDGAAGDNIYGAQFTLSSNQVQYYLYSENANVGLFSPARAEHEFYEYSILPHPAVGKVVINEFLANNQSDVKNEFHLNEDWIELFNTTNYDISLSNCYLSNNEDKRSKYAFPDNTIIPARSFLMVWADEMTIGNQLHASFKLNNDGDDIYLTLYSGNEIDSKIFSAQSSDKSEGRCPDGYGLFEIMKYPSYGQYNCFVGIEEEKMSTDALQVYPVPSFDKITLRSGSKEKEQIKIYNLMGELISVFELDQETSINVSLYVNGIYFIKNQKNESRKFIIQH